MWHKNTQVLLDEIDANAHPHTPCRVGSSGRRPCSSRFMAPESGCQLVRFKLYVTSIIFDGLCTEFFVVVNLKKRAVQLFGIGWYACLFRPCTG